MNGRTFTRDGPIVGLIFTLLTINSIVVAQTTPRQSQPLASSLDQLNLLDQRLNHAENRAHASIEIQID